MFVYFHHVKADTRQSLNDHRSGVYCVHILPWTQYKPGHSNFAWCQLMLSLTYCSLWPGSDTVKSLNLKIECYFVKQYTIITALRFLLFLNNVRGMICIFHSQSLNLKIKCYLVKHYTIITAFRFLLFLNTVRGMICIFTKPHLS